MQPRSFIYVLSMAAFTELQQRLYGLQSRTYWLSGLHRKVCQHHPLSSLLMAPLFFQNETQILTLAWRPLPTSLTHPSKSSCPSDTALGPPPLQAIVYSKPFPPLVPELPFLWMLFCSLHDWLLFLRSRITHPLHLLPIYCLHCAFVYLFISYHSPPVNKLHLGRRILDARWLLTNEWMKEPEAFLVSGAVCPSPL